MKTRMTVGRCCCGDELPGDVQVLLGGSLIHWEHDIFGNPTNRLIEGGNPAQYTGNTHGNPFEYDWIWNVDDAFGDDQMYACVFMLTSVPAGMLLSTLTVEFNTFSGPINQAQDYEFRCLSGSGYGAAFPLTYANFGAATVSWSPGVFPDNGTLTTPNLASLANELLGAPHYPSGGGPFGGNTVPIYMIPIAPTTTNTNRRNEFGIPDAVSFNAVLL